MNLSTAIKLAVDHLGELVPDFEITRIEVMTDEEEVGVIEFCFFFRGLRALELYSISISVAWNYSSNDTTISSGVLRKHKY